MEKSRKPKIRFKGFTDDWEQREFSEMFDCTVPNNTLSRSELSYDEGSILNIHYGDILIKYGSILDIHKYEIPRIPNKKKEDFRGSLLQPGDIAIADTAEDETTGKACEIGSLFGNSVVAGLHTMVARPNIEMAYGYLGYYLNSNAYHCQLLPMMQGIKVLSLSRANVKKTALKFPESIKEQQLIANYFIQLDELITLHQRKLDKLINVKKSMLEKMFPKQGSVVPEIRFGGFTDAWEQRELGQISDSFSGGTPTVGVKDYYGGNIPFIRSAEINKNTTELFLTELGVKESSARLVEVGDILYALYGATSGEVGRAMIKGAINQAILDIKPYVGYDTEYITQWLKKRKQDIVETYLQGGQGNLSGNIVKGLLLDYPSFDEQQQIGSCFKQIDNLITLHQRKLEKLKNIKKSMLEKMFI